VARCYTTGCGELTRGIEQAIWSKHQGINLPVHASVQGIPLVAIPTGDVVGNDPAYRAKGAPGVDRTIWPKCQGLDGAVDAGEVEAFGPVFISSGSRRSGRRGARYGLSRRERRHRQQEEQEQSEAAPEHTLSARIYTPSQRSPILRNPSHADRIAAAQLAGP
jgi:hypothetical protein